MPSLSMRVRPDTVGREAVASFREWDRRDIESMLRDIRQELAEELSKQRADISRLNDQMGAITRLTGEAPAGFHAVRSTDASAEVPASAVAADEVVTCGVQAADLVQGKCSDVTTARNWRFRDTCWDAAALIGHNSTMRLPENIVVILVCVLSFGFQFCFIAVVFLSLSKSPIDQDTLTGFRLWRDFAGHDIRFTHHLTAESLTSRVCRLDPSLHLSDTQARRVREIDEYLYNNAPFNGPMLCLLAMFMWILTVAKEFHVLVDMWSAVLNVPRSGATVFDLVDGQLLPRAFHPTRLLWMGLLSFVRYCIAGSLLGAGLAFLSATHEIKDILLNAIALEFVLSADEILFRNLAPLKTRNMILHMGSMPMLRGWQWRGLDARMLLSFVSSVVLLCITFSVRLVPEIENMKQARDQLCDGYKDFSYSVSELGHATWASPSDKENQINTLYASGRYKVIRGAIENGASHNLKQRDPFLYGNKARSVFGPTLSVWRSLQRSIPQWGEYWNPLCRDFDIQFRIKNVNMQIRLGVLRDAVGDQSVTTCREVSMHCNSANIWGVAVRVFCPETCNCDKPGSSLVVSKAESGCPPACHQNHPYFNQQLARRCTQPLRSLLVKDRIWKEFWNIWKIAGAGFRNVNMSQARRSFMQKGCEAILDYDRSEFDWCRPPAFKGVSFWCPLYCACNFSKLSECPQSCEINAPIPIGTQVPSDL